jgi:hypothetical protein
MSAILGAAAGFASAAVALGIPIVKFAWDTRSEASKAVRLLTGEDETEGDGVIPRLRQLEEETEQQRQAMASEGIEIEVPEGSD